jgi:hypothetical protein
MVPIAILINISLAIVCFSYVAYCIFHGGFNGKKQWYRWRTKQENPRTFYFTVIIFFLVGLFNLVTSFIDLR